jgi:hypothetical protein
MNQFVKTYLRARRNTKWYEIEPHEWNSSLLSDMDRVKGSALWIEFMNQLAVVQQNGLSLEDFYAETLTPSMELQLLAMKSEPVQLAAVQQNGNVIRYFDNPSEPVQLAAVQQDGWAIGYIKNPTDKVKELARSKGVEV